MTDEHRKLAREFVADLMRDAAGPNTGSLATDADAWPNCGIHQDELVERLAELLRTVRLEEAEWWQQMGCVFCRKSALRKKRIAALSAPVEGATKP